MLDGHLIIRPANGKESTVYYGNYGWDQRVQEATSLSFEGRVEYSMGRDLFYGMDKFKEADHSNLFYDGDNYLPQQRAIYLQECASLEKIITNDTFRGYIGPEIHDYRFTPLISYFPDGYWMPEGASIPFPQSQIPDAKANTYTLVSREPAKDTWYATESIKWRYSDGRLTIKRLDPAMTNTVNSSVKDYQMGEAESPWLPFKDKIRSVSVEDKIPATEDWIERGILADRSLTNLKAVDLHKVGVETLAYADSISCHVNDSIATISLGSSFSIIRDNGSRWLELRCGYWQFRNNGDFFEHDRMPSKAADTYTFAGTDPKSNCWIHNNTAVWGLFDGQLTVKPSEGLDEGNFGHGYSFSSSWGKFAPQITSAKIEKKVHIDPWTCFRLTRATSLIWAGSYPNGARPSLHVLLVPTSPSRVIQATSTTCSCRRILSGKALPTAKHTIGMLCLLALPQRIPVFRRRRNLADSGTLTPQIRISQASHGSPPRASPPDSPMGALIPWQMWCVRIWRLFSSASMILEFSLRRDLA